MEREALKLALEALKRIKTYGDVFLSQSHEQKPYDQVCEAIEVAEKALAQPAQEPVAVVAVNQSGGIRMEYQDGSAFDISKHVGQRFYTAPPQPAQEPVGKVTENTDNGFKCEFNQRLTAGTKLYTTPLQRTWVGLTAQEAAECWTTSATQTWKNFEAKLKDKNNG